MPSHSIRPALMGLVLICLPAATSASEQQQPSAIDPGAQTSTPVYRSAFSEYRPMEDLAAQDWRAANDAVARTGGHAGALKDDVKNPEPAPASTGHAGHKH
ncbi:MAG: hypothetical protein ACK4FK_10440 [Ferrovibrio sp.]|uniref:hypothetical protein n=1 Tax=Ferrovibrio sp. TaxID=1917215 RepID=UPI00391D8175